MFSCPKSVSLLHALTGDERVRREISEAHETSWQAALGYLEQEACVVRRGKGGKRHEHGRGFVAAAFRHRTSRAQEPHLHTHVVVANMTQAEDGSWLALDGEAILKTYRLAAGYLYEANLRHERTRRLGLSWTEPVKGMGELERVPEEAIRAFSSRRQSLVEHMEAMGTEGFAASRVAALATREQKEQVDLPRLREEWEARAAELGLGRRELKRLGRERPRLEVPEIDRDLLAEQLFGPDGLTARQTTFALPELVQAVAGSLRDGATVERVLDATSSRTPRPRRPAHPLGGEASRASHPPATGPVTAGLRRVFCFRAPGSASRAGPCTASSSRSATKARRYHSRRPRNSSWIAARVSSGDGWDPLSRLRLPQPEMPPGRSPIVGRAGTDRNEQLGLNPGRSTHATGARPRRLRTPSFQLTPAHAANDQTRAAQPRLRG